MTDRKASVALELQASQFKAEAAAAGRSVDNLDRDVEKLDRDINKIGPDAIKAGAGLGVLGQSAKETSGDVDGLGKKSEQTTDKTDKLGKKSRETSTALRLLGIEAQDTGDRLAGVDKKNSLNLIDDKIKSVRAELKSLASEFNKTGDVSILGKIGSGQKDLAALGKLKGLVSGALKAGVDDSSIFTTLKTNLAGAFEGGFTSPASIAVIGQAIAVALAAGGGLVAGIAGTVFAGAGVAGAVLGHPQQFQAAWEPAIRSVKKDFEDASDAFTQPTLDALKSVAPTVKSWHLAEALAPAVKYVPEITAGVEGLATGVVHGLAALTAKGGPAVAVLADGLANLGAAADSAFSSIADGADGGAEALHDVLAVVDLGIVAFGKLVEGAENAYGFINDHPFELAIATGGLSAGASLLTNALGNASKEHGRLTQTALGAKQAAEEAGHAFSDEGTDLTALQNKLNAAAETTDAFIGKQVGGMLNTMMSLDQATLGFNQSLQQVTESVKTNGHSLDEHTAKGAANVATIYSGVQANIQAYQTNIAAGMGAQQAAAAYDAGTAALNKQLRAAGFTQQAIDGLIGKYRDVPKNVDTDIAINGLETAIRDLNTTLKLIAGIKDKNVIIGVTTTYKTVGRPLVGEGGTRVLAPGSAERYGGIRRAAAGLIVPPRDPGTVLFGEPSTGGEAFIPLRGISKDRAMGLARTVGDSYGFGVASYGRPASAAMAGRSYAPVYNVSVNAGMGIDGRQVGAQVVEAIKQYETTNGAGWRD